MVALSEDGDSLKDIKLQDPRKLRVPHALVTVTRDLGVIKNEIVHSIDEFLSQMLVGILRPFVSIQADCDIKKVPNTISTDLDLMELTSEFDDVLRSGDFDDIWKLKLCQLVERLCRSKNIYPNMIIALSSRVLAAKPYSWDIERLISA